MKKPAAWYACVVAGASLLLAACGDDASAPATTAGSVLVSGTAATGAPMANAVISLRCRNGGSANTTADAAGAYSATVPAANLPCVVSATPAGGGQAYFSMAAGSGGSLVTNISPLTSLALALAGTAPDAAWFASLTDAQLLSLASGLAAALAELNAALADYGLPAAFNAVSSPLVAPLPGQVGNDYDRLLDQFQLALDGSADPSFANLLAGAAGTGDVPALPTPPRTPGATSLEGFFTAFAGDYTLTVTSVVSEGVSSGAATLFPLNSARSVRIAANGDVSFSAVGQTITYRAADYNQDFTGAAGTQNEVRYRAKDTNWLELYISYDPATGELRLDPAGFLSNDEGLATLKGKVFVPPATTEPPATCGSGDDKLVFTNGPADFCGFTRGASATNNVPHYFQFTSTTNGNGTTYVKFNMNSDDSAVTSMVIENDKYAFSCGAGTQAACTGITVSNGGGNYKQFNLSGTVLQVVNGSIQPITVNGVLMHPVGGTGGGGGGDSSSLAQKLSAPFAGTYKLSCYSDDSRSALVERTVVVNADGSSTLDGNVVIGEGHGGMIRYQRGSSDSEYYEYDAQYFNASLQETSFQLRFNADGSLVTDFNRSHDAYLNGQGGTCTGISGPSVGSNPVTRAGLPTLIGSYALTDTLTCSGASAPLPVGSTTVGIDSDGTLRAGTFSLTAAQYTAAGRSFNIRDGVSFPSTSILEPAVIGLTVSGDVPRAGGGTTLGSFFFRFDKDRNATYVQASLNPNTAICN